MDPLSNVIIVANGEVSASEIPLPPDTTLIAADGGARHCLSLGLTPHVVIGDFDSLQETELAQLVQGGARLVRHSADKDETDLELALDFALQSGGREVTLYGLLGKRWDMSFANLHLLASPRFHALRFRVLEGCTEIFILRGGNSLTIHGTPGETVSVIPLTPEARGITYQGLEWPLEDATLPFGAPRGVSNKLASGEATISLREGIVLVVVLHRGQNNQRNRGS